MRNNNEKLILKSIMIDGQINLVKPLSENIEINFTYNDILERNDEND